MKAKAYTMTSLSISRVTEHALTSDGLETVMLFSQSRTVLNTKLQESKRHTVKSHT